MTKKKTRKLVTKSVVFLVTTLLISGCGSLTQRNLKTYPIPKKPDLGISSENGLICMGGNDLSNLTEYVIKLEGQLSKCNDQSIAYN